MRYPLLYALLFAAACTPASKTDDDGDGIMADIDCNDFDPRPFSRTKTATAMGAKTV